MALNLTAKSADYAAEYYASGATWLKFRYANEDKP